MKRIACAFCALAFVLCMALPCMPVRASAAVTTIARYKCGELLCPTFSDVSGKARTIWYITDQNIYMLVYSSEAPVYFQGHCYFWTGDDFTYYGALYPAYNKTEWTSLTLENGFESMDYDYGYATNWNLVWTDTDIYAQDLETGVPGDVVYPAMTIEETYIEYDDSTGSITGPYVDEFSGNTGELPAPGESGSGDDSGSSGEPDDSGDSSGDSDDSSGGSGDSSGGSGDNSAANDFYTYATIHIQNIEDILNDMNGKLDILIGNPHMPVVIPTTDCSQIYAVGDPAGYLSVDYIVPSGVYDGISLQWYCMVTLATGETLTLEGYKDYKQRIVTALPGTYEYFLNVSNTVTVDGKEQTFYAHSPTFVVYVYEPAEEPDIIGRLDTIIENQETIIGHIDDLETDLDDLLEEAKKGNGFLSNILEAIKTLITGGDSQEDEQFRDEAEQNRHDFEDSMDVLDDMTMPDYEDIDTDFDDILDNDNTDDGIGLASQFFEKIFSNEIIFTVTFISFILALVSYAIFGKR